MDSQIRKLSNLSVLSLSLLLQLKVTDDGFMSILILLL